jgi:hypothetical protein
VFSLRDIAIRGRPSRASFFSFFLLNEEKKEKEKEPRAIKTVQSQTGCVSLCFPDQDIR